MDEEHGKQEKLTKHEIREQKKVLEEEHMRLQEEKKAQRLKVKRAMNWILFLLGGALVVFLGYKVISGMEPPYTRTPIHWHASIEIEVCGEKRNLPLAPPSPSGEPFLGTPLLHTHNDNVLHITGQVRRKEEIALGRFFDLINVPFSETRIMEKQNGDACPNGKIGSVKMFVNNKPNREFRNYIPQPTSNPKDQVIKIVFE